MREPVYAARRRFGPHHGERWTAWVAWSGLAHVRELVSLDTILCPEAPERLVAEDWEHNVHADYQVMHFRSLAYLQQRVAGTPDLNVLALLQNPTAPEVAEIRPPGFDFAGFELLDVHGDVSALTDCGGFPAVFAGGELNAFGLLSDSRGPTTCAAAPDARTPRSRTPQCDVWALWRLRRPRGDSRGGALMSGGPAIERIGQVAIPVADLERAVAFYSDVLGLRLLFRAPPGLAFFDCGGVRLMLSRPEGADTPAVAGLLYYLVPDIRAAHAVLLERGRHLRSGPPVLSPGSPITSSGWRSAATRRTTSWRS